jgi:CheY-like chemotaxis protein
LLRSTLPTRVELRLNAQDFEDVEVLADASQLHQVIMNLATNAWHAMGDRPGSLTFTVTTEWLDHENSHRKGLEVGSGRFVHVVVSDTGCGMDSAVLERIFEPFYTTKPPGQGTGLGLSMVHGIMKAHRGTVRVETALGRGTRVHLYLPAAPPGRASEERPGEALRVTRGAGARVLFVDDEPALVDLAVRSLSAMNYRVTGLSNAEQALAIIRATPAAFDIVVTDHNMPGASGIELAQCVAEIHPGLPILLVSGFLREDEARRATEVGVAEIVMKPVTYEQLSVSIRGVLERIRARRSEVA